MFRVESRVAVGRSLSFHRSQQDVNNFHIDLVIGESSLVKSQ